MAQLSVQPQLHNNDSPDSRAPRSACERCRAHKLKCHRSRTQNHLDPCDRCVKAGLDCQTCPSLPPGRPRLEQVAESLGRSSTKRKATDRPHRRPDIGLASGSARIFPPSSPIAPPPVPNGTLSATMKEASTDATNALCSTIAWDYSIPLASEQTFAIDTVGEIDPGPDSMAVPDSGIWTNISQIPDLSFPPPIDKKRYYLEKLAELNSTLLRYVADTYTPSSAEAPSTHEDASVPQVLEFLEEFHSILKYYLLTTPIRSAPRLSTPDTADSDDDSEPEFAEDGTRGNQPLISLVPESQETKGMDYPTVLALSTCYVSLVRLFRSWLQNMSAILEASDHRMKHYRAPSKPNDLGNPMEQDCPPMSAFCNHLCNDIPHVLPGAQLAGFQLGNYRSLQIPVFMQVSMDLLWRIERAVAALVATDCIASPVSSKNLNLLKSMLQQEVRESDRATPRRQHGKPKSEDVIGLQSLKPLVRTIRKSLRGNVCLQLEEGTLDWDDFAL